MPDNDYRDVQIIHPDTGGVATVPDSSLGQHYRAGWHLLAAEGSEGRPGEPAALTREQVAAGLRARAEELSPAPEPPEPPGPPAGHGAKTSGRAAAGSSGKQHEE